MIKMKFFNEITGINTRNPLLNETIFHYLVYRHPLDSFTQALLENNLFHAAIAAADHRIDKTLGFIARNVAMNMPYGSCGSREAVKAWLANENGQQAAYAEWYFEQATMKKLES